MGCVQRKLSWLRRTPFHPQWLLGSRSADKEFILRHADGLVLDVGCADRWIASKLPHRCTYIGLDAPSTAVELYKTTPDVFADAGLLPFPDGSFDTVLLIEVLEHVVSPDGALSEAARVLKPGGRLLITMPFLYPTHDAPHDYQRYTPYGLVRSLEAAGLRVGGIEPALGSSETAGLLANLSMAGTLLEATRRRSPAILLLPLVAILVPIINVVAWSASRLLPDWSAMSAGHRAIAYLP